MATWRWERMYDDGDDALQRVVVSAANALALKGKDAVGAAIARATSDGRDEPC
jgi:hypothetical protein